MRTARAYAADVIPSLLPVWDVLWDLAPLLRTATMRGPADIYYYCGAQLGFPWMLLHLAYQYVFVWLPTSQLVD